MPDLTAIAEEKARNYYYEYESELISIFDDLKIVKLDSVYIFRELGKIVVVDTGNGAPLKEPQQSAFFKGTGLLDRTWLPNLKFIKKDADAGYILAFFQAGKSVSRGIAIAIFDKYNDRDPSHYQYMNVGITFDIHKRLKQYENGVLNERFEYRLYKK